MDYMTNPSKDELSCTLVTDVLQLDASVVLQFFYFHIAR